MLNSAATQRHQAQLSTFTRKNSIQLKDNDHHQKHHLTEEPKVYGRRYSIAQKLKVRENKDVQMISNDDVDDMSISDEENKNHSIYRRGSIIRSKSFHQNPKNLVFHTNDDSLAIIDDDDDDETDMKSKVLIQKLAFILLPNGIIRTRWDVYMAIVLAFVAFYVPYRVCLQWNEADVADFGVTFWLDRWIDLTFAIDISLNFITAYEDKNGTIITSPHKIALRYLKGSFFIDIIATLPFQYLLSNNTATLNKVGKIGRIPKVMKILRIIRLLKLLRVYRLQQFLVELEIIYNIHHGISRMVKIVSVVLTATHIVGCFWYLVGLSGGDDMIDGGWVYRYGYNEKETGARYISSIYWAFSTLTTVGYGDISARTPQEQCYSMVMMLLGVSWYAYIVSSMSSIMASFDAQSKAVREKLTCVNEFCRAGKLPKTLSSRVRNYFEYKLSNTQRALLLSCQYDADELLDELSSELRSDVLLYVERELVSKIKFFTGKPPQFISDMVIMLQPMYFQDGDVIVNEGSEADEMFFLTKGKAAVHANGNKIAILTPGSYFGEIGCIMGGIRRASITALSTCEIFSIGRRNLNFLLSEYPLVAEELKKTGRQRMQTQATQETVAVSITGNKHENVFNPPRITDHSKQVRELLSEILKTPAMETLMRSSEKAIEERFRQKLKPHQQGVS